MSILRFFKRIPASQMKEIQLLCFRYGTGNAINAFVSYELEETHGRYLASICPNGEPEEKTVRVEVSRSFAEEITALLRRYGVGSWNEFHGVNRHVLDGRGFSFKASFAGGGELSAQGYMSFPRHYREVRAGLDGLFMSLLKK